MTAVPAPIEIRRFRWANIERILEIERAVFRSEAYTRRMFRGLDEDCGELFLIGKRGRRIRGYIATCVWLSHAELISIAVEPGHRRSGIGEAMLLHTIAALRARGATKLELMVSVENPAAIRFYRRHGFRRTGIVARYYDGGVDGMQMRKRL